MNAILLICQFTTLFTLLAKYSVLVHLIKICGSHGGETKIKTSRAVRPLTLKNNAWRIDLKPQNKSEL